MAITIATGTRVDIAKTYGSSINVISFDALPEIEATVLTGHGLLVGDFVEVSMLNVSIYDKRIVRISATAANAVTLEGLDGSDPDIFPASGASGSLRKISQWDEITQIRELSVSGGDQKFTDTSVLAENVERQFPVSRSASALQITVMDDPSLGWVTTIDGYSRSLSTAALRMRFPNGSRLVTAGYWSLQQTPNIARNEAITSRIDFSFAVDVTRYAS